MYAQMIEKIKLYLHVNEYNYSEGVLMCRHTTVVIKGLLMFRRNNFVITFKDKTKNENKIILFTTNGKGSKVAYLSSCENIICNGVGLFIYLFILSLSLVW